MIGREPETPKRRIIRPDRPDHDCDPDGTPAEIGSLLVCECGAVWQACDPRWKPQQGQQRPGPLWVRLGPFNRWLNRRRLRQ